MSWGLSGHASREDVSLDDVARARAVLEARIAASAGAAHGARLEVDPRPDRKLAGTRHGRPDQ